MLLLFAAHSHVSFAQTAGDAKVDEKNAKAPAIRRQRTGNVVLHEQMMQSTFKLMGPTGPSKFTYGTGVIIGRPCPTDPNWGAAILVTANHVLKEISGDEITLFYREKKTESWETVPVSIKIRKGGRPLWKAHPTSDIAALNVTSSLPPSNGFSPIPLNFLATDRTLDGFEVGPGELVFSLGYPMSISSGTPGEFAVLRSGYIASHPLLPTSQTKSFLIDTHVFQGNSGGPVYLLASGRGFGNGIAIRTDFAVLGILTSTLMQKNAHDASLGLGAVIHASLVAEMVNSLPKLDCP